MAGDVAPRAHYKPFGETAAGETPEFGFTGQRFEASIGIYDYRARWYDPAIGRFLSPDPTVPDPFDLQSYSRYSYVRNDPVNRVDPTGLTDYELLVVYGEIPPQQTFAERAAEDIANSPDIYLPDLGLGGGVTIYPIVIPTYGGFPSEREIERLLRGVSAETGIPVDELRNMEASELLQRLENLQPPRRASVESRDVPSGFLVANPALERAGRSGLASALGRGAISLSNKATEARLDREVDDVRRRAREGEFNGLDVAVFKVRVSVRIPELSSYLIESASIKIVTASPDFPGFPHTFRPTFLFEDPYRTITVSDPIFIRRENASRIGLGSPD